MPSCSNLFTRLCTVDMGILSILEKVRLDKPAFLLKILIMASFFLSIIVRNYGSPNYENYSQFNKLFL
jgi:hypothetical protein